MDKYIVAPPNGSTNNGIGAADRKWKEGHFEKLPNWQEYLAESTGYGIVSGCEPSISGLTVTVAAGVVHLADGTRKEIAASSITLDAADTTNPRIDLVYITSAGAVAKVTGTAAASPSAPSVPTNGISVTYVSVAANASTGTVMDIRRFITCLTTSQKGMTGDITSNSYSRFVEMLSEQSLVIIDEPILIDGDTIMSSNKTIICVGRGKIYTQNGVVFSGSNNKLSVTVEFPNHKGLSINGNNNHLDNCIVYRSTKATYNTIQYTNGCLSVSGINNVVSGGEMYNGGFGVILSGSYNTIENAYVHDTFTGVIVPGSSTDTTIINNIIKDITMGNIGDEVGILVKDPARRIKIKGNRIDTTGSHGMYVQSSDSIITDNTVSNCMGAGIKLASYEENEAGFYNVNSLVANNICSGNTNSDIYLQNTCKKTLVCNNNLTSTSANSSIRAVKVEYEDYVANSDISVLGNKCAKAISIMASGVIKIIDNTCTFIEKTKYNSDYTEIVGNTCSDYITVLLSTKNIVERNVCKTINFNYGEAIVKNNIMNFEGVYNFTYIKEFCGNEVTINNGYMSYNVNYTGLHHFCDNSFILSGTHDKNGWVNGFNSGTLKGCVFANNVFSGCGDKAAIDFYGDYNIGVNNITDSTASTPINMRGTHSISNNNLVISS